MNEDFLDAHKRHWEDAERLFTVKRWANADHLYGIAAECGLKGLAEKFKQAPLDKGERRHIMEANKPNNAWDVFETYRSGHALGPKFLLPTNPFTNWDVSQRYAHQSNFDEPRVAAHRQGADLVNELIKKADFEGLL